MPGATIWLTGLPGSGKSTIATAIRERLLGQGRISCLLDGDELRRGICSDLGFSANDRAENARRAAHMAHLVVREGIVAVVSLVSPFASDRAAARQLHLDAGLAFIEVWVATPPEECERRDPKGLWRRARNGELTGFTGVDDPYEPPTGAEVVLRPGSTVPEAVDQVLGWIP